MEWYQLVLIPIAFGLIGFVEPCSIGANIIFLGYLNTRESSKVLEALKFTITRAFFLGSVGFAVGILGQSLRAGAYSYSLILGILYVALGLFGFLLGYWGKGLSSIDLCRYFPKESAVPLGVIFGLSAPACSLPLFLALLGLGVLQGAWIGFVTLFLFCLALSAPLVWIACSRRSQEILRRLGRLSLKFPYLSESVLILVGVATIFFAWKQI